MDDLGDVGRYLDAAVEPVDPEWVCARAGARRLRRRLALAAGSLVVLGGGVAFGAMVATDGEREETIVGTEPTTTSSTTTAPTSTPTVMVPGGDGARPPGTSTTAPPTSPTVPPAVAGFEHLTASFEVSPPTVSVGGTVQFELTLHNPNEYAVYGEVHPDLLLVLRRADGQPMRPDDPDDPDDAPGYELAFWVDNRQRTGSWPNHRPPYAWFGPQETVVLGGQTVVSAEHERTGQRPPAGDYLAELVLVAPHMVSRGAVAPHDPARLTIVEPAGSAAVPTTLVPSGGA
jgi:hypothetical protein